MTQQTRAFGKTSSPGIRRLALAAVLLLALAGTAFYQSNPVIGQAEAYATRVAAASGGTYVGLRSLNAFLSSVQEVEVGGSFVVQGSVQPLKVLEPVDDTVERVASVVFVIMLVAGVCSVAMAPLGAVGMGMIAIAVAVYMSVPQRAEWRHARALAERLGRFGMVFALGVPLSFLFAALAAGLTNDLLEEHRAIIRGITEQIAPLEAAPLAVDTDWTNWLSRVSGDAARYTEMAGQILGQTDEMIRSFLAILAIYIFQMVLLPLLFFCVIVVLGRNAVGRGS